MRRTRNHNGVHGREVFQTFLGRKRHGKIDHPGGSRKEFLIFDLCDSRFASNLCGIERILISDIRYRYTDIEALAKEAKCMNQNEWNRPRYFFAWGIFALVAVIVASVAVSAFFYATRPGPVAGTYYPYFFFPFPLFFIFGIFAFFWIVRWLVFPWRWGWAYRGRYWRYQDESYYIIRERYAKGEITKEQFEQMMRDLQQHATNQL